MTQVLPVRPSLEHLRREAKHLLVDLRAGAPEALSRLDGQAPGLSVSLATAQLIVAREHGFSSWAAMKLVVVKMASGGVRYDKIGAGYRSYREPDPRIAAAVNSALGGARTIVNVGAGTGSYEPKDRPVIPVEPSVAMAVQRDPTLAPAVLGVAESLPLADRSVDASMAVLTMHHWTDQARGIAELLRVTRKRVVILTIDVEVEADMWLLRDYVPQIVERDRREFPSIPWLLDELGGSARAIPVAVPADCRDGFLLAFWSRPESVLNPSARAATSGFARLEAEAEAAAVAQLQRDLESGVWDQRNGTLRTRQSLDAGLRVVVADVA